MEGRDVEGPHAVTEMVLVGWCTAPRMTRAEQSRDGKRGKRGWGLCVVVLSSVGYVFRIQYTVSVHRHKTVSLQ